MATRHITNEDERDITGNMKTEDLTFIGNDPGAVKYGNFINYYSFHSTKERTDNLNRSMFLETLESPVLCLDIGCNTGELSKELYSYLKEHVYPNNSIKMLAVDIDPMLIQRANETNDNPAITFAALNVMDDHCNTINNYLQSEQKDAFCITFCFSVTMWIHINNGDEGLQNFLNYIQTISETIIIEPQPWNCYRNAQRRIKKSGNSFPLYESLKIRSNVEHIIEDILSKNKHRKVCNSDSSSWNRKILSFQSIA